jgi:octaprenyl-diphosphate synthase
MKSTATIEELYRPVQAEIDAVRETVTGLWHEALRLVRIEGMTLPKAGGKLLRPALCLLSAGAIGGTNLRQYVSLAAAFEALHLASLAHDDVIDRALLRRGNHSLNALWDNHAAVLGGDYLVARAVEMLAAYDSCPIIAHAITSVRRMAEGELYFFGRENEPFREEDCILLAKQKTASLFAEACAASTYLIAPERHDALHSFGISLGIAFQIVDDLLDLTQPAEVLGKPACGDLVEGKQTLPIIHLRAALGPEECARLDRMRGVEPAEAEQRWVAAMMEQSGVRAKVQAIARGYADDALAHLGALPPSPCRESIAGLVEFTLTRAS